LADSFDEAIIMDVDTEEKSIRFYNLTLGKTYVLNYDQATNIKNRFGDDLVAGQLSSGDMVQVTFLKDEHLAKSILYSDEITITNDIKEFEINGVAKTMSFSGDQYSLCKNLAVLADGKEIELNELTSSDTLKVVSKEHVVYGIEVEIGHGYVRLSGQESFVGGFIEIGKIILQITEDMLIPVPEGDYSLYASNEGLLANQEISIKAGEEILVDLSSSEVTNQTKNGKIVFTISPSNAKLYIDGKETDYSSPVELTCGIHQIRVKADGYKTVTQYIKVGQTTSNLNIEMEESDGDDDDDDSAVSSNTVSNTATATSASNYRVYIDAPEDAEVYLDGTYVGTIPTSFAKKTGTYVLSLRKEGYQTRSITIQIDDSKKDISYSFSELAAKEEDDKASTKTKETDSSSTKEKDSNMDLGGLSDGDGQEGYMVQ